MATTVAAAIFVSALLASGAAASGVGAEAKYSDVLQGLQNISQPQLDNLRGAIILYGEEAAHEFVAWFKNAVAVYEAEGEAALKAAAAQGKELPSTFSMGGDGNSDEPLADTIRRILREGLPSQGIPPLDPFRLAHVPVNIEIVDVLLLEGNLTDLAVEGLAGFREDVDFDLDYTILPPRVAAVVKFDVLVPRLHLRTLYEATGYAEAGVDIRGEGPINIDIFRFRVQGDVAVRGTISTGVTVDPCEITISSRSFRLKIEGLFGGGLLSDLAGDIVSDMVNEYVWDLLFRTLTSVVQDGVCDYLRSMTLADWIRLITRFTSMPLSASPPQSSVPYNVSAPVSGVALQPMN